MSFLSMARRVKEQQAAARNTRSGGSGGSRDKIGNLWLGVGDRASIRIIGRDSEVVDGVTVRLGNPARVCLTKIWKDGKPGDCYLSPETFTGENPLEEARTTWMKDQYAQFGKDHKIDWKRCPIPSTQPRFIIEGLVCAFEPGAKTREAGFEMEKKLGMRAIETSEDVMLSLLAFANNMALLCVEDRRTMKVRGLSCPNCSHVLLTEADCAAVDAEELVRCGDEGLARLLPKETQACPKCRYDLNRPVTVKKYCQKCDCFQAGLSVETANIVIHRTGDKNYAFSIDDERVGGMECLDDSILALTMSEDGTVRECQLGYDPATQVTTSNIWGIDGASPQTWAKLGSKAGGVANAVRPKAPLVTLSGAKS